MADLKALAAAAARDWKRLKDERRDSIVADNNNKLDERDTSMHCHLPHEYLEKFVTLDKAAKSTSEREVVDDAKRKYDNSPKSKDYLDWLVKKMKKGLSLSNKTTVHVVSKGKDTSKGTSGSVKKETKGRSK